MTAHITVWNKIKICQFDQTLEITDQLDALAWEWCNSLVKHFIIIVIVRIIVIITVIIRIIITVLVTVIARIMVPSIVRIIVIIILTSMLIRATYAQGCQPESVSDLVSNKEKYSAVSRNLFLIIKAK